MEGSANEPALAGRGRSDPARQSPARLGEVSRLFLRLGFTAFGGPAAHIAMMRREIVERRSWVSDQYFLDMLGATYLIPGPNSTELAIHLGFVRAGWKGLIAAGTAFILPAMLIVLSLAWLYVQYGTTTEASWLLYGVKPVIIAILLQATWGLGKGQVRRPLLLAVGAAVFGLYLAHFNEIALCWGPGCWLRSFKMAAAWPGTSCRYSCSHSRLLCHLWCWRRRSRRASAFGRSS